MSSPVVLLLSGGLDSTVLLHDTARAIPPEHIHTLAFDYGQRHRRELDCAEHQSIAAGAASHRVVDLSSVGEIVAPGTTLVSSGDEVPDLSDLPQNALDQPPTYVPNRNMTLLSVAAAYAEAIGARALYYGAQAHDEYGYWDCTTAFLDRMNAVLALNRRDAVSIEAPFVNRPKHDIVRRGVELEVDFARTWSCYRGGEVACGTCPTCVERRKAFERAGVADPLAPAAPD